MPEPQTLVERVRAKYPGAYDDLSDTELDAKVRAKYPGVYDDLPKPASKSGPPTLTGLDQARGIGPEPSTLDRVVAAIGPAIRGAGDVTGANWFLEKTGLVPEGRLRGPEQNARDTATRHTADVGGNAMLFGQMGAAVWDSATRQGLTMAQRAIAAAQATGAQITPAVKYEAVKWGLTKAGVPGPIAFGIASMVSGYGEKGKPKGPSEPSNIPPEGVIPSGSPEFYPPSRGGAGSTYAPQEVVPPLSTEITPQERAAVGTIGTAPPRSQPVIVNNAPDAWERARIAAQQPAAQSAVIPVAQATGAAPLARPEPTRVPYPPEHAQPSPVLSPAEATGGEPLARPDGTRMPYAPDHAQPSDLSQIQPTAQEIGDRSLVVHGPEQFSTPYGESASSVRGMKQAIYVKTDDGIKLAPAVEGETLTPGERVNVTSRKGRQYVVTVPKADAPAPTPEGTVPKSFEALLQPPSATDLAKAEGLVKNGSSLADAARKVAGTDTTKAARIMAAIQAKTP